MLEKYLSFDEFCDKHERCRECPLNSIDSCKEIYTEIIANDGVLTIDIEDEIVKGE